MLLSNTCSSVVSIKIVLKFDDNTVKERTIGVNDLIDVEYNESGVRKAAEGRVVKVYADGTDTKKWYIVVDSADDYASKQYKLCPSNILDLDIIQKSDATQYIYSTNDVTNIKGLRIVSNQLQYTQNGSDWLPIKINETNVVEDTDSTTTSDGLSDESN